MSKLIVIAGATASGKSAAALALAQNVGGEIVSADSMQVYRHMNIGTAKPSAEEQAAIAHHMIDVCEPTEPYSLADYVAAARTCIDDIFARGKTPIVCGGTGLYIDTLVDGTSLSDSACDPEIRARLTNRAVMEGSEALWRDLCEIDPESAATIHPNNVRRVIRALEIFEVSGVSKSEWDRRSAAEAPPYDTTYFVIEWADRERLYERIERRVDMMLEAGLEDEVRALYELGALAPESIGGQAIGYKEFVPYFEGRATLGEVSDAIKQATRRYAKRQQTWFRRRKDAVRVSGSTALEEIMAFVR